MYLTTMTGMGLKLLGIMLIRTFAELISELTTKQYHATFSIPMLSEIESISAISQTHLD